MKLNVLSLFDGMSCGQQALERCGIEVENYYASEIDKYAIQVTMANYPNTIQLGSVVEVDGYKLPKIDLLIGGSPCQSFSFAGKRKGMATKCETEILTLEHYLELKSEGYEFEGQSYLFWEFMRLLNECKPKYFLLENVEMGEKWEKVLSKAIGVNGIHINSALVSAQNRKRIYWTNIGMQPGGLFGDLESIIQQPKDKGILLKDILESEVDEKYFLSEKAISSIILNENNLQKSNIDPLKSNPLQSPGHACGIYKGASYIVHNTMPRSSTSGKGGTGPLSRNDGKTYCLDTGNTNAVEIVAMRGRGEKGNIEQQLETNGTNKSNSLTTVQKDNLARQLNQSKESQGKQPYQHNRVYDVNGINPSLTTLWNGANLINIAATQLGNSENRGNCINESGKSFTLRKSEPNGVILNSRIRRLTPIECERLQTVKDNYTNHVSDSQRYKMLGNGWTIDVIAHIFNYLK
jgi:DNA (cytosine-5)-methyltransferase 3A